MNRMLAAVVAAIGLGLPAVADAAEYKTMPLFYGVNRIDLDDDGHPDLVLKTWTDNFNGHSHKSYRLAVRRDLGQFAGDLWETAVVQDPKDKDKIAETIDTWEGADCTLSDIRMAYRGTDRSGTPDLLTATREFGDGFADKRMVTLVIYRLLKKTTGEPGDRRFLYAPVQQIKSRQAYCNVSDAFAAFFDDPAHF